MCNKFLNKKDLKCNAKKENIVCSLYEVEYFLNNFSKAIKCLEMYKFIKY